MKSTPASGRALRQALRRGAGGARRSARRAGRDDCRRSAQSSRLRLDRESRAGPSETERPAKSSRLRLRRPSKVLPDVVDAQIGSRAAAPGRAAGSPAPALAGSRRPSRRWSRPRHRRRGRAPRPGGGAAPAPAGGPPRRRAGASAWICRSRSWLSSLLSLACARWLEARLRPKGGEAVESAHHVFPMISEVTERIVQAAGSSCATTPGRLAQLPRRQPEARTRGVAREAAGASSGAAAGRAGRRRRRRARRRWRAAGTRSAPAGRAGRG